MGDVRPVRLQLSRRRGFDLQALSIATNGLPAVVVSRPTRHGNPHDWRDWVDKAYSLPAAARDSWAKAQAVQAFKDDIDAGRIKPDLDALRGCNLACWCGKNHWCHGDVLLELANKVTT